MKIAYLFAGQGSQTVGMGQDLYEAEPAFREVFDLLTEVEKKAALAGPDEKLADTAFTQPVMLAFGLGVFRVLEARGLRPALAAGLSLGEYTALAAAGVWSAAQALELVRFRAGEMKKAATGVQPAMTAVLGMDPEALAECCREASSGMERAEIANRKCPRQIVIAGSQEAVREAERLAAERGARRCLPLNVSGPFHTSYMEPAGSALRERLSQERMEQEAFPVLHNCTGRKRAEGEDRIELLARQVCETVQMEECIRQILAEEVDLIVEIGPGKALQGFVRKLDRNVPCISISTAEDIEAALAATERG